jgi:hypothetical protein
MQELHAGAVIPASRWLPWDHSGSYNDNVTLQQTTGTSSGALGKSPECDVPG